MDLEWQNYRFEIFCYIGDCIVGWKKTSPLF